MSTLRTIRLLEVLLIALLVAASVSLVVLGTDDAGDPRLVVAGSVDNLAAAPDDGSDLAAQPVVAPSIAMVTAPLATPAAVPTPTASATPAPEATTAAEPAADPVAPPPPAPEPDPEPTPEPSPPPPAPEPQPEPEPEPAPCDWSCRGERIVAGMALDIPSGWRIEVMPGRGGEQGRTFSSTRTIELYVRDSLSDSVLAYALEHEAAHSWDFTTLTRTQREQWADARGYPEKVDQWYGGGGNVSDDRDLPAGDFAEAAAACVRGPAHHRSGLGGPPTADQCQLVLSMVGLR